MQADWLNALFGGVLIGFAASMLLFLNGRVAGISGIINGVLKSISEDSIWRIFFIFGLLLGGIFLKQLTPFVFYNTLNKSDFEIILAGFLVGFGTIMGSGCTSGHGVCGISRMSPRSFVATIIFILAGIFSVIIAKKLEHL